MRQLQRQTSEVGHELRVQTLDREAKAELRRQSLAKMEHAKKLLQREAKRLEMAKPPPPPIMSVEEMILVGNLRFERDRDPLRLASLDWSFNEDGTFAGLSLEPTGSYEAAVVVQSVVRTIPAKKEKKSKKEKKKKKDKEIQDAKEEDAATVVQAATRGKKGKKKAQERAVEVQEEKEDAAATAVQVSRRPGIAVRDCHLAATFLASTSTSTPDYEGWHSMPLPSLCSRPELG